MKTGTIASFAPESADEIAPGSSVPTAAGPARMQQAGSTEDARNLTAIPGARP